MQIITGTIKDFKTSEAKKGKFGDYFSHVYTIDEHKYSKFSKGSAPEAVVGSLVSVVFELNKTDKGEFRNITKIEVKEAVKEVVVEKKVKLTDEMVDNLKPQIATSIITAKDLAIARMNAVTSALAFLGDKVTGTDLDEVLSIATRIVKYTTEPLVDASVLKKLNK
jgi:hypothetical protein